jgi:hypothetical protein
LYCDSGTPEKRLKSTTLTYLLSYIHPEVTTSKVRDCVTWSCIANITKQNNPHNADSRSSNQEINSLLWNHFVHNISSVDSVRRELKVGQTST